MRIMKNNCHDAFTVMLILGIAAPGIFGVILYLEKKARQRKICEFVQLQKNIRNGNVMDVLFWIR